MIGSARAATARGAPSPLGPTGGAALYRRAAFDAAGGFDERIFLYYEDLDLALRMSGAASLERRDLDSAPLLDISVREALRLRRRRRG